MQANFISHLSLQLPILHLPVSLSSLCEYVIDFQEDSCSSPYDAGFLFPGMVVTSQSTLSDRYAVRSEKLDGDHGVSCPG